MKVELDTVYSVSRKTARWDNIKMHRGLLPTVTIDAGTVDVYISNEAVKPTDFNDMIHDTEDTMETDKVYKIDAMFRWILFKQATGTTTNIETEGLIDEHI